MMREMRRQDRKLEPEEIKEILKNGEYGILATVTNDDMTEETNEQFPEGMFRFEKRMS